MAAYEETRKAITKPFIDGWNEGTSGAVQYPNREFTQPQDAEWARFNILDGQSFPAVVGTGMTRHPGVVMVEIFIPKNKGSKLAYERADVVASIYDYKTITTTSGCVVFETVGLNSPVLDGNFWKLNASVTFRRDEIRS